MTDTIGSISLGLGVFSLLFLLLLAALEEKIARLKNLKLIKSLSNGLVTLLLFCGAVFVLTLLWSWMNQPTAFEKCMNSSGDQVDPKAIDWLMDYCSQQTG